MEAENFELCACLHDLACMLCGVCICALKEAHVLSGRVHVQLHPFARTDRQESGKDGGVCGSFRMHWGRSGLTELSCTYTVVVVMTSNSCVSVCTMFLLMHVHLCLVLHVFEFRILYSYIWFAYAVDRLWFRLRQQMSACMNLDGQMDGWTALRMDGWMYGWMDGWMYMIMYTCTCVFI